MAKRRKDEEERVNDSRSVIDRATEARRQREAEIAARRQEEPNVSVASEPSSPRESRRRRGGNSQFSGWADDVRSYTPGGRKKRDNTTSKRWARELDSENQRSEQMDMRRTEAERSRRKEQAKDLSPEKQREEQVKAMREAWRGKDPDASRKVTTDASQTKVPATPLKANEPSPKPKAEPETPGEFFPTSSEPLPSKSLDIVGALTGAKAGMLAGESGPPKTAYQQRQEEKGAIQAEYDSLFDEYSALANTINWGKIGKDYTREDVQRLNEMEIQLGEMKTQLGEYDKNVEWEGRQSLVDERNALWNKKNNYGSFMYSGLTPEEEKRLEELEGLIAQGDAAAGNPEQFYSGVERVEGAVFGGAVEGAANIVNAAGTLANAAGYIGEHYGDPRADAGYATDELAASYLADATEEEKAAWAAEMQKASEFGARVEEFADSLSDSAAKDLEMAKAGLGDLGQAGIDVVNNMVGMGMDMALSPLTGGSTLAAMFVRTFGGATAEARKNGADPLEQLGYGVTDAAIEVLTEKMGDGLAGFYGGGASDDLANAVINNLTNSKTGRALLNILYSSYEEGAEEVVSDLLHPLAERIYNDQAIKDILDNGYPLDQLIYDYLIGATIGTIGGVSSSVTGEGGAMGDNVTEALASAAAPEQSQPGIRQAPGMEIGQEADGGEGKPFSPADALAESAAPTADGERKTSGEDRAEEEAPPEPKTPSETLAEAATPKAEEERRAETEEKPEEKPEAEAEETKEKGPDEILTEAATPKEEEWRKTTGEEKAEGQSPEAPKTPAEKRSRASELRNQASKLWDEIEAAENSHANEDPDAAAYYEGLGEEAERLEAEAESLEKEAEEDELWGASEPVSPASTLAEAATPKGKAAEAPSEAAESKKGSDHESVPPSTRESTAQGDAELNSDGKQAGAEFETNEGSVSGKINSLKGELKGLKPSSPEYEAVERDIHWAYNDLVESAKDSLTEIERFKKNPDYDDSYYDSPEEAQADYEETIKQLREAGLPPLKDLRTKAYQVGARVEWARRKADKFREAFFASGKDEHSLNDNLELNDNPEYKYYLETESRSGDEAEALHAVCDFLEEHYAEVYGNESGTAKDGTVKKIGGDKDGGAERRSEPVESDEGGHGQNPGEIQENDAGGVYEDSGGEAERSEAQKTRDEIEAELSAKHAVILDPDNPPRRHAWIKDAAKKVKSIAPDCEIIVTNYSGEKAYYRKGVIVFDAEELSEWARKASRDYGRKVTPTNALMHETAHFLFDHSDYSATEIIKHIKSDFANDPGAIDALNAAYDAHKTTYHPDVKNEDGLWEEVIADLYGDVPMAFGYQDGVDPFYDRLRESTAKYMERYVVESYDGKRSSGLKYITPKDPGQNKSWGESLKANDPGEAPETGERADDDMTPLNEQSRERDEERREQAKADTKKRMGRENHERMTKALDKLDGFAKEYTERYGEVETDEHGGIVEDKDGNAVKNSVPNDVAKRLRSMLEGEETVQSFREYYESLRPAEGESSQTDSNFFYDGALAETLSQFADAERELIYAEKGGPANAEKAVQFGEGLSKEVAKENYDKAAEAFALSLGARLSHLQRNFENKVKFNGEVEANAKEEKSGLKGMFGSLSDSFWRTQMRVDTFLKSLVGFSGEAEVTNDLAQRTADSTIKRNNVRNSGREFFRKLAEERKSRKALADFEAGKTKGNVNIPGLGKVSMDYEVAVLKTLMTNGALDHIARFGAQFLNETDYRKGTNNNGRGDTEGYKAKHRITREALDQMARDSLAAREEKLTGKAIYKEKISILKSIRAELMRDVNADPTAKAVYDASVEAMKYLAGEINDTTLRLYGLAKALQGPNYWPMVVYGRGNNLQFINNQAFTLEDASYLQHRRGGSGALFIAPFTETMDNYINRASKFVGFGELNSDLLMMSKEMGVGHGEHDAEKQSIQSVISKVAGEKAADYMRRYVELLNGQNRGPSKIGSTLRGNLARSSLVANPGVAIKQTASYMNAAGIIDFDLLLKNRLVTLGGLRTARSYDNNALIQAINERTGMLKSRSADNTVELGEANSARELSNRLTKWMPNWLTNWIQTQDYKTIANLALACGEQVKRNHNGRIDTNSDAYYSEVAKLLEQVTAKTQPIYDAEFRAEYLRSDSELVRMLAMFRTQQSQNLNNLMQAYGELSAAKREGGDVKAASRKVNQTVAGFVAAQTVFAVLSSAAKMLLHKQKDYEDEDGNIDIGKVAKRLGLDFLESAAGVVWFGDTLAKVAVDAATGVYAKATGKKEAATQEFYQLSDNTISIVNNLLSSFLKAVKDPSAKNIKTAVFDASQATGIPARNLYNIANSAIMYYKDARRQNPENYDDIISLMEKRAKMTPAQRTKATANEAMSLFRKGEIDKGYALLATLDYSDRNVVKNTKTVAGQAYINGDIDEATYRRVLASTKMTKSEIDKAVGSKSIDKTIAGLAKYDEDKYGSLPDEIENARANAGEGRSKSSAAARIIVDAAMSKNGQDAFMAKYTTPSYQKAFDAASKVKGVSDVVDALAAIDTNRNDSFTQKELYLYAQETGHDELVRAIWEANGWKTSYDTYRKNQAKKKG